MESGDQKDRFYFKLKRLTSVVTQVQLVRVSTNKLVLFGFLEGDEVKELRDFITDSTTVEVVDEDCQ